MGRFLDAAIEILRESSSPLGPKEIVQEAMERGLLWSEGLTPSQTMKSKISTDILKFGERSLFMRAGKGKFALRETSKTIEEYHAERFIKKPVNEDILVVQRELFFRFVHGPGLTQNLSALKEILFRTELLDRLTAEKSEHYIQLISFFLVKKGSKFISYKRTGRLPEKSLKGAYSLGFGGHMTEADIDPLFIKNSPLTSILPAVRELDEELELPSYDPPRFRGLMYDDSNPTSKIHVGLVFEVKIRSVDFKVGEKGNFNDVKLESPSSIKARIGEFESWSRYLISELNKK